MNVKKKPKSLRSRLGSLLPAPVKRSLIWLNHRPAKIHAWLFQAASKGKIPCPDKLYLKWMFKVFTGQKLNLKNPVTYQDKLNWLKLYYRVPLHTKLVDKYAVREWVADKIGEEYLVPLYGVYERFEDIDFDKLPNQFVLKCTHDQGSVVICKDKEKLDLNAARKKINDGLNKNLFYLYREWPYKNVKPRIICEKLLVQPNSDDLPDYKFFCFGGNVKFLFVYVREKSNNVPKQCNIYDRNFNLYHIQFTMLPRILEPPIKPVNFKKMVELAEVLSADIPFVRVDFYNINSKIYFGEMTFFPSGARHIFQPEEFNKEFGSWITLPEKTP